MSCDFFPPQAIMILDFGPLRVFTQIAIWICLVFKIIIIQQWILFYLFFPLNPTQWTILRFMNAVYMYDSYVPKLYTMY